MEYVPDNYDMWLRHEEELGKREKEEREGGEE